MSYPTSHNVTIHADDMASPRITSTPANEHGQQIMLGGLSVIATYVSVTEAQAIADAWARVAAELRQREPRSAA
jgi:hypothetical protein